MENKLLTVDRIEGEFAVCELPNGGEELIPLSILPENIKEGNVVEFSEDKSYYIINAKEEEKRRNENFSLQEQLFKRNKK